MAALSARQVRELVLRDCVVDMVGPDSYFFRKLFSFESLSVLEISVRSFKYAPNVVKFGLPNLKFLTLYFTWLFASYDDVEDFFHRLLAGCPVVEELNMYLHRFRRIEIHNSTLRKLHVWSSWGTAGSPVVILEALNLKELDIVDVDLAYMGSNTPLLSKARISRPSPEALRAISNSKDATLHLGRRGVHGQLELENLAKFDNLEKLPRFDNLTFLNLRICSTCDPIFGLILGMLTNCPHLQNIVLHFHDHSHEGDWMPAPWLPQCLLSSLTFFEIHSYKRFKADVDILKYFLRNGAVLKKMRLMGFEKERGALKKLLMPHMVSSTCTVTFDEFTYV